MSDGTSAGGAGILPRASRREPNTCSNAATGSAAQRARQTLGAGKSSCSGAAVGRLPVGACIARSRVERDESGGRRWPPVVARWSRPPLACWPVEPPEPRHSAQPLTRVRTLTRDRRRQSPRPGTGSRPAGLVPAGPAGWSRSSGSTRCRALARKAAHTSSPTAAGPVLANSRHQGDGTDAGSASAHRRRRGQGLSDVGVAVAAARAGPNRIVMREALLNRHDLLLLRGPSVYPAIPGVVLLAMVSAR